MTAPAPETGRRPVSVVALGGGHGLAATLTALRRVTDRITAVVTVADDGGSSGRLRGELGILPPGDLRMALAALAADDDRARLWADVLQHRFAGEGPLAGHALGNLLFAALDDVVGDPVEALTRLGTLLGLPAGTCVVPMSTTPLEIVAEVVGLDATDAGEVTEVVGQVAVATTRGHVVAVHLRPADPPACAAAVAAIDAADWIVFGPGSWFTSVLPHLLVPELRDALFRTRARRLVALNLAAQSGETEGFSPATHLEVLGAHAPQLNVDVVLADAATRDDALAGAAESLGGRLVLAPVALGDGTPRHDPARLAEAYATVFDVPLLAATGRS